MGLLELATLLAVAAAPAIPETEQGATQDVPGFSSVRDAAPGWSVDGTGVLWRKTESGWIRVIDGVRRAPVDTAAGPVIVREGAEPGTSSLWLVTADGVRALTPEDAGHDLPFGLPDGRIAFVSTRTSVASVWVLDPATGEMRQLTNVGLVAGRPWTGFVPVPAEGFEWRRDRLSFVAGDGRRWFVDPTSGAAFAEDRP